MTDPQEPDGLRVEYDDDTPVAIRDAPDVREVVRLADPLGEDLREHAAQPGTLHLAAVAVAAEFVVPPILRLYRERYPDVEIKVAVGNRAKTLQRVLYGEADVAIGGRPPESAGIGGEPFLENQFVVVASPDHPLAGAGSLDADVLSGQTWLLREHRSGDRRVTEDFWNRSGIDPSSVITLGSNGVAREAAAVGLGLALVSGWSVASDLHHGRLVQLLVPGTPVEGSWYALTLGRGQPFATAQDLLDLLHGPELRAAVDAAFGPAVRFLPRSPATA
jgi:LysR family transcriptional regulator, low CO2-responsive transcriptional regulator